MLALLVCLAAMVMVTSSTLVPVALAQVDPRDYTVVVNDVTTRDLDRSSLLRVELDILNNGDEEAMLSTTEFELLDSDLKQYGSTSGYELRDKGESISWSVCDQMFESINPGLWGSIELCYEIPVGIRYDSLILYDNMFIKDGSTARVIPLVDDSVGLSTLEMKIDPGDDEIAERADEIESSGGCLIATAAYGTELDPAVQNLRDIRNKLYTSEVAGGLMHTTNDFYYMFSPAVADFERQNPVLRDTVRILITPFLASFAVLDHNSMDTDSALVWYVALMAALNIVGYVGAPVVAAVVIRKSVRRATRCDANSRLGLRHARALR